jgi:hypothetical protein
MTKDEGRMTKEIKRTKDEGARRLKLPQLFIIGHWCLVIGHSSFVIGHSFVIRP